MTNTEHDVLIAGMGPVGKLLAIHLSRHGHNVLIVERHERSYPLPRAVAMDGEIARLLQNIGLSPDRLVEEGVLEPFGGFYDWVNDKDELLFRVDSRDDTHQGWASLYFYHQPTLEALFDAEIERLDTVTILRGVEAQIDESVDGGRAEFQLTDLKTGEKCRKSVQYAVAADGARSPARQRLGIEWNDLGYFFNWLVVDLVPKNPEAFPRGPKQLCDWRGPVTIMPGGPGRTRWEFMLSEEESADPATAEHDAIWKRLEKFSITPEDAAMERSVVYTFRSGWAEQWRKNRAFLVGDAAHLMPPFAGQGLASGIRDVANLAWKLDLVLKGKAGTRIFDSYGSERTGHVSEFIEFSVGLGSIICIDEREAAQARDEAMKAALVNPSGDKAPEPGLGEGLHQGEHGGVLSRQGQVNALDDGKAGLFDDVFGPSALIARAPEFLSGLSRQQVDRLAEVGATVAYMAASSADCPGEGFQPGDATYEEWFSELSADVVLVRPDLYVYGTAAGANGAVSLVENYLEALR